jgi:asparagine synthase (glutamine-hydrolysing)
MCGIAAVINGTEQEALAMGEVIKRRGIESNVTTVGNLTVYFTHLPIETSEYDQPFTYKGYTVWLNGFISNWKELCKEYSLIAYSDTELLAWWIAHKKDLSALNGFFAVLYYDGKEAHTFTDRYGIKQLYKTKHQKKTYICSEVKGFRAISQLIPDFDAVNDWEYSLGVMTDNTIWQGIERVDCLPLIFPEKIDISYEDAKVELLRLWKQSVERNYKMFAGCYLSGGVDSGMIAHWMSPDYSFSVDYQNELSEIENIKINSRGIHHTLIANYELAFQYSWKIWEVLDDLKVGSCYTNFAIAELASKFCRVMYSGAGGDEVFSGYMHRYNKPINDVIKRTSKEGKHYDISHREYDFRYLKGILVIEDRMSGFHTMETRYPFLDNDLVNFALSLPEEYLENKRILKDISGLPKEITEGKKRGFSNPHYTNEEWVELCLNFIT